MIRFSASVDGTEVLDRAFNRITEYISDFRPIWPSVAAEFYAIEREQFDSQGGHGLSGTWAKLSPAYAKWKAVHHPGMPILQATGALYASMTSPDAADSVFRPETDQLTIGSKREGATAHQRGRRLPARPPISLTEADKKRLTKAIQLPLVQFVRRQGFNVLENAA